MLMFRSRPLSLHSHVLRRRCLGTSAGEASLRRATPNRGQMLMFRSRLLFLQTLISSEGDVREKALRVTCGGPRQGFYPNKPLISQGRCPGINEIPAGFYG